MDISKIVDSEQLFTLDICHPSNDKETLGITFKIRSESSDIAKNVLRRHADNNIERNQRRKIIKSTVLERQESEKAASFIATWDWGENTWQGEVPEFSTKKAIEILEKEDWIYEQVVMAASNIANFLTNSGAD